MSSVVLLCHHLALYSVDDMITGEEDWQQIEKETVIVQSFRKAAVHLGYST
jgi:hypothetical protein